MSLPHPKKRTKRRPPKPAAREALAHSVNEFAARARVSRPTVYRMMKDGALRFVRIRGRRLIPCTEYTRLGFIAEAAE
jgi:excisionase family DNA binding protein